MDDHILLKVRKYPNHNINKENFGLGICKTRYIAMMIRVDPNNKFCLLMLNWYL